MYKKLFQISNLYNGEICRRLNIDHNQRKQYERSGKIKLEVFVAFGKKLSVPDVVIAKIVWSEIVEICKKQDVKH